MHNLFITLTKSYLSTPHMLYKPDKRQRLFFLKSIFFSPIFKRLHPIYATAYEPVNSLFAGIRLL